MIKKIYLRICFLSLLAFCLPFGSFAETVGVFCDSTLGQVKFAVGDIKTALESKGHTVEILSLSTLNTSYANKKIVISLATDSATKSILVKQGGIVPNGLGQQAYGLQTTTTPQKTFWVLGGDANGAMYGGLQIAENIQMDNLVGTYDEKVSPDFIQRGVKLNLPLDKKIPTYSGYMNPTSTQHAIKSVWDMNFWTTWIDQQARNRYNVLSVWVHHPFPALVKVPDYEMACLPAGIEGYFGYADATLTHEKRVEFWKKVMTYAHNRGFQFYFFCWNICLDYAKDQYTALTELEDNTTTIDYLNKSIKALLETYPELDGFGISAGDNMDSPKDQRPAWTWKAYGKALYDYAIANPDRKFTVIHRGLGTALTSVYKDWSPLTKLPNFKFDYSVKYANAHMYSTLTPRWYETDMADASSFNQKTWLTLRNDDFLYMDMGDPEFVRGFLKGIPYRNVINSFYIGSDIYMPTRTFFCKDAKMNGQLEIQRNWYIQMLWGRLSYNKQTSDAIFKNQMAKRYPQVSSETLFNAWALAARPLPKMQELIQGNWGLDAHWYAEGSTYPCNGGNFCFRYLNDFLTTDIARASSSNLCNIANSAAGTCGTAKTTYKLADEMEADAQAALALINGISSQGDASLEVKINNIKQLAYLSTHFAYKIRAATYLKANQTSNARDAMGVAYCWWVKYSSSMFNMYNGNRFRTVEIKPDWHYADAWQLKDYTDLGGVGVPNCDPAAQYTITSNSTLGGTATGGGKFIFGTNTTLTATPNVGYIFVNWTENGITVSSNSNYKVIVTSNRTFVANFSAIPSYKINVSVNPENAGTVSGGGDFKSGQTATVKAVASSDYKFLNWTQNGSVVSSSASYSFTVTSARNLVANFSKIPSYQVSLSAEPEIGGSVSGGGSYKTGDTVTVSAIASQGYSFTNWTLNGTIQSKNHSYTFVLNAPRNLGANFTQNIDSSQTTSVKEKKARIINIYPNPTSGLLYIDFETNSAEREIELYNTYNQLVYRSNARKIKESIDLKHLNLKGLTIVQVNEENRSTFHKVFVK